MKCYNPLSVISLFLHTYIFICVIILFFYCELVFTSNWLQAECRGKCCGNEKWCSLLLVFSQGPLANRRPPRSGSQQNWTAPPDWACSWACRTDTHTHTHKILCNSLNPAWIKWLMLTFSIFMSVQTPQDNSSAVSTCLGLCCVCAGGGTEVWSGTGGPGRSWVAILG